MKTIIERNGSTFPVIWGDDLYKINEVLFPLMGKVPADLPKGRKISVTIVLGDKVCKEDTSFVISDLEKGELFAFWSEEKNQWIRNDNLQPLAFEGDDREDEEPFGIPYHNPEI